MLTGNTREVSMTNDSKLREEYHRKYIDYIVDISQVSYWRALLFENSYNIKFLISKRTIDKIPIKLRDIFSKYDLKFYVSKVVESDCPENFDGLVIFKFEAAEFPNITWYSGNNSDVI